jgi:hypothetical protein
MSRFGKSITIAISTLKPVKSGTMISGTSSLISTKEVPFLYPMGLVVPGVWHQ